MADPLGVVKGKPKANVARFDVAGSLASALRIRVLELSEAEPASPVRHKRVQGPGRKAGAGAGKSGFSCFARDTGTSNSSKRSGISGFSVWAISRKRIHCLETVPCLGRPVLSPQAFNTQTPKKQPPVDSPCGKQTNPHGKLGGGGIPASTCWFSLKGNQTATPNSKPPFVCKS